MQGSAAVSRVKAKVRGERRRRRMRGRRIVECMVAGGIVFLMVCGVEKWRDKKCEGNGAKALHGEPSAI
jgi:hypothetical protein